MLAPSQKRVLLFSFLLMSIFSLSAFFIFKNNFDTRNQASGNKLKNYWPMQLGNSWAFAVTEFDSTAFGKWKSNFLGNTTGKNAVEKGVKRDCNTGSQCTNVLGSKLAMSVYPTMGYNRFFSSRYVKFFKESECAYHGPIYCNIGTMFNMPTSWNLQWYMHNPVTAKGNTWLGSEGGVRLSRSVLNYSTAQASQLETRSLVSTYGKFPMDTGFHSAAGRYPELTSAASGLPGYTYLPLQYTPDYQDYSTNINPDLNYTFAMGCGSDSIEKQMSSLVNTCKGGNLRWELEFLNLTAKDVLKNNADTNASNNVIADNTPILEVIFFEPYYAGKTQFAAGDEIACEAYYFAENIGPVKITHSIVSVLPGDDVNLSKTREFCFWIYKDDFAKENRGYTRTWDKVKGFVPDVNDISKYDYTYSYPRNSMELTSYKLQTNTSADELGFHSPSAASTLDQPMANMQIYYGNGRYWVYKPDGTLYYEGDIQTTWSRLNPSSVLNPSSWASIYPWSNGGPDAVEYGGDIPANIGYYGLIINDGAYWTDDGSSTPFKGPSGTIDALFPNYVSKFGYNTDNLALSSTGIGEVMIAKNGYYIYYKKGADNKLAITREGWFNTLTNGTTAWMKAPTISGVSPTSPDTMMYGSIFSNSAQKNTTASYAVQSEKQLVVFQQGKIWVKYGLTGAWENWAGQLR